MTFTSTQLLHKLFNDPKTGFTGADKLLRRAKESNPKITLKQVKEFLSLNQVIYKVKDGDNVCPYLKP